MKYNVFFLLLVLLSTIYGCSSNNSSSQNNISEVLKDTVVESEKQIGIKMTKVSGVYQIPCIVNGVKMNFIFDTGASNVCISLTEARFLAKNGYLEKEDYIGRSTSQIADGSVVENMEINLHSIEVGGVIITDVKAVVVNSTTAPLLLGQSALKKLGKIEIDGDSLFIVKKGEKKHLAKKTSIIKVKNSKTLALIEPKEHWYDAILAKIGYDKKIEEYLGAAWIAYENDLPDIAYSYCEKALDLKEAAKIYGLKGYLYSKQIETQYDGAEGQKWYVREAVKSLEKYYELNKDKQDFGYSSGDTLFYEDQVMNLAMAYAKIYNGYNEFERMIELGKGLYLQNPNNINAMIIFALAYTLGENFDMAEKWAKKLLETNLDNSKAFYRLAYLSKEQGRNSEAIRYYEKCLEIDNADKKALNNLANIYWEMSLYDNGYERSGEKWDTMRAYAVYLWQKSARLGNPYSQRILKEKGYEW